MRTGVAPAATDLADLASRVIDERNVETLFQPLVHLPTNQVVGFEALTRGPRGTALESPLALLEAAEAAGRLAELDWLCAASACAAARDADLHPSMSVFLNFEPTTLLAPCPDDLLRTARQAKDQLRVFVETKESSLLRDPGRVFAGLVHVREIGWGVAIDNAIASPESLGLFPLIRPDVVKLDLRAAQGEMEVTGSLSDGARMYAEQSGAAILAEGLESDEDARWAAAAGAAFGQGWLLGRPAPLTPTVAIPRNVVPLRQRPAPAPADSPSALLAERLQPAMAEQRFLQPLADYLITQSRENGPPALLLVSLEHRRRMTDSDRARLAEAAEHAAFTMLVSPAPEVPARPRLIWKRNTADDLLHEEWCVVVLGQHYAAALVARDVGDEAPIEQRRFEYAVTHDRELVLVLAQGFLQLAWPEGGGGASGASQP